MADFFQTMSRYMPPPPEFVEPPILWGSEDHVRQLFEDTGMGLQFDRDSVQFSREESVDEEIEFSLAKFGPTMMAKAILEPQGRWEALRNDIAALIERNPPAEYLVILGRKP